MSNNIRGLAACKSLATEFACPGTTLDRRGQGGKVIALALERTAAADGYVVAGDNLADSSCPHRFVFSEGALLVVSEDGCLWAAEPSLQVTGLRNRTRSADAHP